MGKARFLSLPLSCLSPYQHLTHCLFGFSYAAVITACQVNCRSFFFPMEILFIVIQYLFSGNALKVLEKRFVLILKCCSESSRLQFAAKCECQTEQKDFCCFSAFVCVLQKKFFYLMQYYLLFMENIFV